nr:hypothetical protein [Streptomyces pinistramenti]
MFCYGVAASELAARRLALMLARTGRRALFLGATGFALADALLPLGRGDTVVVFPPGRPLDEFTVLVERARAVGAKAVFVTDVLGETLGAAPHTPTGVTAGSPAGLVVTDALLLAPTTLDETRAGETPHHLTALREQLLAPQPKSRGTRGDAVGHSRGGAGPPRAHAACCRTRVFRVARNSATSQPTNVAPNSTLMTSTSHRLSMRR